MNKRRSVVVVVAAAAPVAVAILMTRHSASLRPPAPAALRCVATTVVDGAADPAAAAAYADWIDKAMAKVGGDDARDQQAAAEQLSLVIPYAPARAKVLAGLRPLLADDDKGVRCKAVAAFAHWATPAEVPDLVAVVASPPHPKTMSGDAPAWASATAALACLMPAAADLCVQQRKDDFFYRVDLDARFATLAAGTGPTQRAVVTLWAELEPEYAKKQMSIPAALNLLRSGSAASRVQGADALSTAVIDASQRRAVLTLLTPHLKGANGRARLSFVNAFAHWATATEVEALEGVVAYPEAVSGISGHEDCWSAAVLALARLDPVAADRAMASRHDVVLFRMRVPRDLKQLAEGPGPCQANAIWLLGRIGRIGRDGPPPLPLPPGFTPQPVDPGHPQPVRRTPSNVPV